MKLTASLTYPFDERILTLFEPEKKTFGRASYRIEKQANNLLFSVEATDATALRACLTTITKVLSVWETTTTHGSTRTNNA